MGSWVRDIEPGRGHTAPPTPGEKLASYQWSSPSEPAARERSLEVQIYVLLLLLCVAASQSYL